MEEKRPQPNGNANVFLFVCEFFFSFKRDGETRNGPSRFYWWHFTGFCFVLTGCFFLLRLILFCFVWFGFSGRQGEAAPIAIRVTLVSLRFHFGWVFSLVFGGSLRFLLRFSAADSDRQKKNKNKNDASVSTLPGFSFRLLPGLIELAGSKRVGLGLYLVLLGFTEWMPFGLGFRGFDHLLFAASVS